MAGVTEDYAAQEPIRDEGSREVSLGLDPLTEAWRGELRTMVRRLIREELIGLYLSGTDTRRVKLALRRRLKGIPLSKRAVSQVVTGPPSEPWSTAARGCGAR
jgi:hypothetical protein